METSYVARVTMILPRTGGLYTQQKKKVRRLKPKRRTEARRSPSSLQSMRHGLFREQCCLSDRESLLIQIDTRNTLSQYAQQLIRDGVHDFSASFDGLIVQNDTGNRHSPTVIAAAITSQTGKAKLPTHIELAARQFGLPKDSVILLEQIRTLDKKRLREHMGRVDGPMMHRVDAAIAVSFGLHPDTLV